MSFSVREAGSFFGPLRGKTSTFVLGGRQANLSFAQMAESLLTLTGGRCAILDLDAFYSSNAGTIFGSLPMSAAQLTTVYVPEPGSSIETVFPKLFSSDSEVIIIDSLNSLYHLLSLADGSSRSRKLAFAVASLSYLARSDRRTVIFTMYRRERLARTGGGRSIADLSDITSSVEVHNFELSIRCDRGSAWPEGRFSIRIP